MNTSSENTNFSDLESLPNIEENIWMMRSCGLYKEEFDECKRLRARLRRYYIYGDFSDTHCQTWKEDFYNCNKYYQTRQIKDAAPVIQNEVTRREKRLRSARGNNVWEYRTEPPEHWNAPLQTHHITDMPSQAPEKRPLSSRCSIM